MRIPRPLLVLSAVVAAVAVNLAIYAIGAAAGADYTFPGADGAVIPWLAVVGFSAVPLGLALTVVALLAPGRRWVTSAALIAAPALLLVSIPLMPVPVGFDTPTTVALSLMHVALAPIAVVAILGIRRSVGSGYVESRSTIGSSASA